MQDVAQIWQQALPDIRDSVTGVGIWTALNGCRPVVLEDGQFVIGLRYEDAELSGHLRMSNVKAVIERKVSSIVGHPVTLRVIEGDTLADWEMAKRRDAEANRLKLQAAERARVENKVQKSWEVIYEQLARKFAATPTRSLPQNRARFFLEAVDMLAEALTTTPISDDLAERNYARCIERVAQYTEVPSVFVALKVLERTFNG